MVKSKLIKGILLWLGMQLAAWVILITFLLTINLNNESGLVKARSYSQIFCRVYPYISLGLYRLPGINLAYDWVSASEQVLAEGLNLKTKVDQIQRGEREMDIVWWREVLMINRNLQPKLNRWLSLSQKIPFKTEAMNNSIHMINRINEVVDFAAKNQETVEEMLGFKGKVHYVVLLQNNTELWPTGGYLGTYSEFFMDQGKLVGWKIEAIDVPNGQIKGYVEAPKPISKYTHSGGTPGWRLRESNWEADFVLASKDIEWFFIEGGLEPIDGMMAINLIPVKQLLELTGEIAVPDYQVKMNAENYYSITQTKVESEFFDGSIQKTDFMSKFGKALLWELESNWQKNMLDLAELILKNLDEKQILLAVKNPTAAEWLKEKGWDGRLRQAIPLEGSGRINDYIHINEANLGINKTNCCLERQFTDEIVIDSSTIRHHMRLYFNNLNPGTPDPPRSWGGGYKAYTRLYLPIESELIAISQNEQPLDMSEVEVTESEGKRVIGFLVYVNGGNQVTYSVDYTMSLQNTISASLPYDLSLQKQSGIESLPWDITVRRKTQFKEWRENLRKDITISLLDQE